MARVPEEFLSVRTWTTLPKSEARPSAFRKAASFTIQLFGFPGYWCTIVLATLLDVIPAAPHLNLGGQEAPWLLIWFVLRVIHLTVSSVKSTWVYAQRLRSWQ